MNAPTLGLDIARADFTATLLLDGKRPLKKAFANTPSGFRQLESWLRQHFTSQVRAGLEATNRYGEALCAWLYERGHQVHVISPDRIHHYARSCGQRNKTDPADALLIARFVATHTLPVWKPAPAEKRALQELCRLRQQLLAHRQQLLNQIDSAPVLVRPYLERLLSDLDRELHALAQATQAHVQAHPVMKEQIRLLSTVKGIGQLTATIVFSELPPIDSSTDPRVICAWAGLTPSRHQSGRSEGPSHLSRRGNSYLRNALFMPALVAKRFNPLLRSFAQKLSLSGKRPRAILGAVAHKLLRILIGVLRHQRPFDPNWIPQNS
jgi:transposase